MTVWILIPKDRRAYIRIYRWVQENAIENKVKGKGVFIFDDTEEVRAFVRKQVALWDNVIVYKATKYTLSDNV